MRVMGIPSSDEAEERSGPYGRADNLARGGWVLRTSSRHEKKARPAQDDSRANRYPHDGVVKVCQLAPLDRDGQRDSDRQLAAVRIRLDFVALFRGVSAPIRHVRIENRDQRTCWARSRSLLVATKSVGISSSLYCCCARWQGGEGSNRQVGGGHESATAMRDTHPQIRDIAETVGVARVVDKDEHVGEFELLLVPQHFGFVSRAKLLELRASSGI